MSEMQRLLAQKAQRASQAAAESHRKWGEMEDGAEKEPLFSKRGRRVASEPPMFVEKEKTEVSTWHDPRRAASLSPGKVESLSLEDRLSLARFATMKRAGQRLKELDEELGLLASGKVESDMERLQQVAQEIEELQELLNFTAHDLMNGEDVQQMMQLEVEEDGNEEEDEGSTDGDSEGEESTDGSSRVEGENDLDVLEEKLTWLTAVQAGAPAAPESTMGVAGSSVGGFEDESDVHEPALAMPDSSSSSEEEEEEEEQSEAQSSEGVRFLDGPSWSTEDQFLAQLVSSSRCDYVDLKLALAYASNLAKDRQEQFVKEFFQYFDGRNPALGARFGPLGETEPQKGTQRLQGIDSPHSSPARGGERDKGLGNAEFYQALSEFLGGDADTSTSTEESMRVKDVHGVGNKWAYPELHQALEEACEASPQLVRSGMLLAILQELTHAPPEAFEEMLLALRSAGQSNVLKRKMRKLKIDTSTQWKPSPADQDFALAGGHHLADELEEKGGGDYFMEHAGVMDSKATHKRPYGPTTPGVEPGKKRVQLPGTVQKASQEEDLEELSSDRIRAVLQSPKQQQSSEEEDELSHTMLTVSPGGTRYPVQLKSNRRRKKRDKGRGGPTSAVEYGRDGVPISVFPLDEGDAKDSSEEHSLSTSDSGSGIRGWEVDGSRRGSGLPEVESKRDAEQIESDSSSVHESMLNMLSEEYREDIKVNEQVLEELRTLLDSLLVTEEDEDSDAKYVPTFFSRTLQDMSERLVSLIKMIAGKVDPYLARKIRDYMEVYEGAEIASSKEDMIEGMSSLLYDEMMFSGIMRHLKERPLLLDEETSRPTIRVESEEVGQRENIEVESESSTDDEEGGFLRPPQVGYADETDDSSHMPVAPLPGKALEKKGKDTLKIVPEHKEEYTSDFESETGASHSEEDDEQEDDGVMEEDMAKEREVDEETELSDSDSDEFHEAKEEFRESGGAPGDVPFSARDGDRVATLSKVPADVAKERWGTPSPRKKDSPKKEQVTTAEDVDLGFTHDPWGEADVAKTPDRFV